MLVERGGDTCRAAPPNWQALQTSAELQAFLLQFSDTLRAQTSEDAVCMAAIELLAAELHVDDCHLVEIDLEADTACVTHHLGRSAEPRAPYSLRMSEFPAALRRSTEQTLVCADVASDPALSRRDRDSIAALQVRAFITAALRKGAGKPIWAMGVACVEPRNWTPAEVALVENVAERTWAARERARAEQALRDADRRKDEFLALLAHELRNPLAAISNASHILQHSDGNPQVLRATGAILQRQVALMVRQVDDLLDMGRIRRDQLELRKECINLATVASDAVESTRPLIEAAHHELTVALPAAPLYVLGDPARLSQVIGNLLHNAAKFTQRGGRVWLVVEQQGEQAVVRVRDNGMGIPDAARDCIFELFFQAGQSEHARGGLGIGLALVRKLVELHGGTVSAQSMGSARGTEFTVRLPALTNLHPPPPEPGSDSTATTRRRVLVVDDNRDSANSLATLLTLLGHEAETAHDGVEAVKKAVTFRPDLILLDIGMPRLDGYEAVRWIREQGHSNLTIVALTGWGQEEDRRKTAAAGFDAHVVKPIDVATLTQLLAAASQAAAGSGDSSDSGA